MMDSGEHYRLRELARQMVTLENAARWAESRGDYAQAGELMARREELQVKRSRLMRDLWFPRLRTRLAREEALA